MINQTIVTAITKHGVNLLKIGLVTVAGSIANQILKGLTYDTLTEMVRDVRWAKNQYEEKKQSA